MKKIETDIFYITTPIYYVNAKPHLGHTYTTVACDSLARYHRLRGDDTFFLTGTDEHGDKIVETAKSQGKTASEYADEISNLFRQTWEKLNITNDDFIRTTEPRHKTAVSHLLNKLKEEGNIYFSSYTGKYCVGCERYLTDKELNENGECLVHLTKPKEISEENYFFKMQKFLPLLKEKLQKNPNLIRPQAYYNETLALIDEMISTEQDLCISRPKSRLEWGIELPFDKNFVSYVWFDALTNYISALNFPTGERFHKYFPHTVHMIGKDILKPHAIFWPTMLLAAGLPLYQHLIVHGYWLGMGDLKMSKSLGNAVDPVSLFSQIGEDALRFFLMREMNFGFDARFSEEALKTRLNADLANDLGNLIQRTFAMLKKYKCGPRANTGSTEIEKRLKEISQKSAETFHTENLSFKFHKAIEAIFELVRELNKIHEEYKPWVMAKEEPENLPNVLNAVLKGVVFALYYLRPFLPHISENLLQLLRLDPKLPFMNSTDDIQLQDVVLEKWPMLFARLEFGEK